VNYSNGDKEAFVYDPMGNRLSRVFNGQSTSYNYDVANELVQAGTIGFSYDGNGAQIKRGQTSLQWDIKNRLIAINYGSSIPVSNFSYDPLNRRVQKVDSTGTFNYFYDGNNEILESFGNAQRILTIGPAGLISRENSSGQPLFYLYDGNGNVINIVDSNGQVLQSYYYGAFGNLTNTERDSINASRFVGELGILNDDDSGLIYMRARYYDASEGRFISRDSYTFGPDDISLLNLNQILPLNQLINRRVSESCQHQSQFLI